MVSFPSLLAPANKWLRHCASMTCCGGTAGARAGKKSRDKSDSSFVKRFIELESFQCGARSGGSTRPQGASIEFLRAHLAKMRKRLGSRAFCCGHMTRHRAKDISLP